MSYPTIKRRWKIVNPLPTGGTYRAMHFIVLATGGTYRAIGHQMTPGVSVSMYQLQNDMWWIMMMKMNNEQWTSCLEKKKRKRKNTSFEPRYSKDVSGNQNATQYALVTWALAVLNQACEWSSIAGSRSYLLFGNNIRPHSPSPSPPFHTASSFIPPSIPPPPHCPSPPFRPAPFPPRPFTAPSPPPPPFYTASILLLSTWLHEFIHSMTD